MIGKIMYVLIKNCSKGWRFDETSCYFNVRILISLFLSLNFITLLMLVFPRKIALKLSLFDPQYPFYLKFLYPVIIFLLLTLMYPRKNLLHKYLVPVEREKSIIKIYLLYCIISIGLIILASA
jgi:hypothetical protein